MTTAARPFREEELSGERPHQRPRRCDWSRLYGPLVAPKVPVRSPTPQLPPASGSVIYCAMDFRRRIPSEEVETLHTLDLQFLLRAGLSPDHTLPVDLEALID